MKERNAFLSVYDKEGIVEFAKGLVELGFKLYSSGGTAAKLKENGLNTVDVSVLTGFPPILGHRVVTLHPNVHGGILAKDTPEHNEELAKYGMHRFNLVCVNLYPLQEEVESEDATVESVIEKTDIGGPTLLRAAAKNYENVIVVSDPDDMDKVLSMLSKDKSVSKEVRLALAVKVFRLMENYNKAGADFLENE